MASKAFVIEWKSFTLQVASRLKYILAVATAKPQGNKPYKRQLGKIARGNIQTMTRTRDHFPS